MVLVQSAAMPDWDYAFHNADYFLAAPPQARAYRPEVSVGDELLFRLRANPTFKRDGKRLAWLAEGEQRQWLDRKAEAGGFQVARVDVIDEGFVIGKKRDGDKAHELKHKSVRFDGLLVVTDPDKLVETIRQGVGSAKAFGFGLLSVAP